MLNGGLGSPWGSGGKEDKVQTFYRSMDAVFRQCPHHTGEGRKGVGSRQVFRALRHLACDYRRPQGSLRPIVGRLDARVVQEAQQVSPVMMVSDLVEQPLVVRVLRESGRADDG